MRDALFLRYVRSEMRVAIELACETLGVECRLSTERLAWASLSYEWDDTARRAHVVATVRRFARSIVAASPPGVFVFRISSTSSSKIVVRWAVSPT